MTDGTPPFIGRPERVWTELACFFALTFAITWSIAAIYVLAPEFALRVMGEIGPGKPWFYVAVYAPSVSALILAFAFYGKAGLQDLWRRLVIGFDWRIGLLSLLIFPIAWLILDIVQWQFGLKGPTKFEMWFVVWPLMMLTTAYVIRDPGMIGEEIGWRGFALPRLVQKLRALDAGALLGLIWGIWHLPAFLISTMHSYQHQSPIIFVLGAVCLSIVMTWLWANARQSIFIGGMVPHIVINSLGGKPGIITSYAAYDFFITIFILAALAVLTGGRDLKLKSRRHAA